MVAGRLLPRVRSRRLLVAAASMILASPPACRHASDGARQRVVVFAAASMTDALFALEPVYEAATGRDLRPSYGASSDLARQIRDGAPAAVFLSASRSWIDYLVDAGMAAGEPLVIATNRLACIVPEGSALLGSGIDTLGALGKALYRTDLRFAIAEEGVPAGDYTREALSAAGVTTTLSTRLVGQKDVRAVLRAVERGALDGGFVYASDVDAARVRRLFDIDPRLHTRVEYAALPLRGAGDRDAAARFIEFLRGDVARRILAERGFTLP